MSYVDEISTRLLFTSLVRPHLEFAAPIRNHITQWVLERESILNMCNTEKLGLIV